MAIIHVRIDDRLIHGQVATMWTNNLGATRIMVVDDAAAESEVMKMSLKLATPNGVSLSVLPIAKAAQRINEGNYEGQRVLMIIKSPGTLLKLVEAGVEILAVNVGNLTYIEGKIKVNSTVAVTKEDVDNFRKLYDKGVKVTTQLIPSNSIDNFMNLIKNI